ncbi:chloride channel protein [uncultured Devosia sp.]|uniref:chloride channel protein n=1 Tax=uncultured Devosia sp. TaxID=211434 RepID=UPI0035CB12D2
MTEATNKAAAPTLRSIGAAGRYRGLVILALAGLVGIAAGLVVTAMSWIAQFLHTLLFGISSGTRLSAQVALATPALALVPAAGGLLIALTVLLSRRFRTRPPVDPIEANAVHGGRMSTRESLLLAAQTLISSGFGASVGLEAGYTQLAASIGSRLATLSGLRRNEIRTLVGCGAAGAIAAAFGAPLTGAFYGFELIIGVYSIGLLGPIMVAALTASLVATLLGAAQTTIHIGVIPQLGAWDALPFILLGIVGGGAAIAVMRLVVLVERGFAWTRMPPLLRPVIGGLIVGGIALLTPQALSSGHGALDLQLGSNTALNALGVLFVLKALASAISLGSGFRGGLFFASLFLGALLGKAVALAITAADLPLHLDPTLAALVGMASMAVGVVGGPLTMTFLVLEVTGDLAISVAVLAASIAASVLVRETFGFSFSTWRLHLRGESIRGAHDVGRLRNLTVGSMMRPDVKTARCGITIEAFREAYPLGSTERVVVVDDRGRYAGIVLVADAYARRVGSPEAAELQINSLLKFPDYVLMPWQSAEQAAARFEQSHSEELAVVQSQDNPTVVGLLTEAHLYRRYAEELDKSRQDLTGET